MRFIRHDASDRSLTGTYDLVTIFEAVHDMARPVEALRTARGLLAPGGCLLVADEKVHDRFTVGDQDPVERWMYGFSVLHCLPVLARRHALGGHRHRHAHPHHARLRPAGRLPRRRDRADRARLLALLPPQPRRRTLTNLLETLYDLAHPVQTLNAARTALAPGGAVLVADTFTALGDEVERIIYGWSVTHCLPTQLVGRPSPALGTVMRSSTVRELADQAGYARVDGLPVDDDFFRLYRLHP